MPLFALIAVGQTAYSYWNSDKLAIRSMDAYEVTPQQAPELYEIVQELSSIAGQPMPRIYIAPTMSLTLCYRTQPPARGSVLH